MKKMNEKIRQLIKKTEVDYDELLKMNKEEIIEKLSIYHEELIFQNDELKKANLDLQAARSMFHDLFNESPVPLVEINDTHHIVSSNKVAKEFFKDDLSKKSLQQFISSSFQDAYYLYIKNIRKTITEEFKTQIEMEIDGKIIHVTLFGNMVKPEKNSNIRVAIIDHTEEKKYQSKIEFLASHDQLTGAKNRRYYEILLEELTRDKEKKVGIIYFDLDNLKLINDAFGHSTGDEVLILITKKIIANLRKEDVLCRIGGDEFVVFIFGDDSRYINLELNKIASTLVKTKVDDFEVTASFGFSIKNSNKHDVNECIKEAEENMYTAKLSANKSGKLNIISSILNALYGKYPIEEEHSNRVAILMEMFADALGFSHDLRSKYKSAGKLHDIGKIAINYQSLYLKKDLTSDEFAEIKKHPEIGYKILLSSRVEASITEAVLYHHEKIDGSGYPKGIKGDNIPVISKALTICDSFDAMVSDRHYKNSLSLEEAVQELTRCSGTHFDSQLVKTFINGVVPNLSKVYF